MNGIISDGMSPHAFHLERVRGGSSGQHRIIVQIKPWIPTEEFLPQVIAFKEGDRYYLAGFEQIVAKIKASLPEIEENYYQPIEMSLEIREGDEIEIEIAREVLLSNITGARLEEE